MLEIEIEKIIKWKISYKPCKIGLNVKLRKLSKLGGKMAWVSGCSKHFSEGGKTILVDSRKFWGGGSFFQKGLQKFFCEKHTFLLGKKFRMGGKTFEGQQGQQKLEGDNIIFGG